MTLHDSTFEYLKPTDDQLVAMSWARGLMAKFAAQLDPLVPDGPDKTYLMRKLREVAMWVNIAITRNADGSPRAPSPTV